jgi:glycosyltransferase involved in cell wall biosynthesis
LLKIACIPALNAEKTIARVIIGCQSYVDKVIVCDDGSNDLTAIIAERLGAQIIKHEQNLGKGGALRSLFLATRKFNADIMVTLDADGQHDPHDVPKILSLLESNSADIVIGSRFLRENPIPRHRRIVNKVLNVLTLDEVSDTQSGFRGYNKHAIQSIIPAEMGMGVDSEILMEANSKGLRIAEVPISVMYGEGKTSIHNPVLHTLDVIFSIIKLISISHPLIFYGIPGLSLIGVGSYLTVITIERFSTQQLITTVTLTYALASFAITLFGLLTLFTGIILFTLSTVVRKEK